MSNKAHNDLGWGKGHGRVYVYKEGHVSLVQCSSLCGKKKKSVELKRGSNDDLSSKETQEGDVRPHVEL